jgi:DNA polymerase family B, exonuclease domain.
MNKNKFSNCKFEVTVANRKNVVFGLEESNMQPPSLVMMSLAIKTKNNSKPENEFFAISATVHNNIDQVGQSIDNSANMAYFSLVNVGKPMDRFGINEFFLNENDLLQNFLNKIQQIDPDIISSHDLVSDVLEKLASRLHHTKPRNWTNLSRVLLKSFPNNCKDDQYSGN